MKRVLITGKNSYIGNSVKDWLMRDSGEYKIDTISMRNESWKNEDLSKYDVIFHVAGIAHVSSDPKMEDLYYKVNRDLTVDVAKKSKTGGVRQFIFMSSIIVYGNENHIINETTVPKPADFYGDSKLQAEYGLNQLNSDGFNIAIVRPPMIYGKDSKGNYRRLSKLAPKIPIFPDYKNQRSMLHIDNLCQFIKLIIDNNESGVFFPQNKEYVNTSELVNSISKIHGKRTLLTKLFNPLIKCLSKTRTINKVFGNLVYEKSMSKYDKANYQIRSFSRSIELTER